MLRAPPLQHHRFSPSYTHKTGIFSTGWKVASIQLKRQFSSQQVQRESINHQQAQRVNIATNISYRLHEFFKAFVKKVDRDDEDNEDDKKKKTFPQRGKGSGNGRRRADDDEEDEEPPKANKPSSPPFGRILLLLGSISLLMWLMNTMAATVSEITQQEFLGELLASGKVAKLLVRPSQPGKGHSALAKVIVNEGASPSHFAYYFEVGSVNQLEAELDKHQDLLQRPWNKRLFITYEKPAFPFGQFAGLALMCLVNGLLLSFVFEAASLTRGGFSLSALRAEKFRFFKPYSKSGSSVQRLQSLPTLKDVAGLGEAKTEVSEFVKFLRHPEKYEALGARIPKGALLTGPPGTGKTMLAKAVAGEAGVPFLSVAGSFFSRKYVGEAAGLVRELFKTARKEAPCIVFIDELDALGKSRSLVDEEAASTINQMLVEMDGFNTNADAPVIILAATNRPELLDKALLRPGRFDRQIALDLPDMKERVEILMVHLKPLKTADPKEELAAKLSTLTSGFSGAALANLCNEAAIIAVRREKTSIEWEHFHAALDRVIAGVERRIAVNPQEKKVIAYHEAGHALIGWLLEHTHPLMKVTIVARGRALGYAAYSPKDYKLRTPDQLHDEMCMALGGRVAEQLVFGSITTGAADDLQRVTKSAIRQLMTYGLAPRSLGHTAYEIPESDMEVPLYGPTTSQLIDEEATKMVRAAYSRTEKILRENLEKLKSLAEELLTKESLVRDDIVRLLGPRPWPETADWRSYLKPQEGTEKKEEEKQSQKLSESEKPKQEEPAAAK